MTPAATEQRIEIAGRVLEGAEAEYVRQARAAMAGTTHGEAEKLDFEASVRVLFFEFAEVGIPPDVWANWPWDLVQLYWDERVRRDGERSEQLNEHLRASRAAQVVPRVMYCIPLR